MTNQALTVSMVDAAIDQDGSSAQALGDLLDKHGAWDWTDDSERDPSDRLAVVESSGAWWCVYRGTESDDAWRFASRDEAVSKLDALHDM